MSEKNRPGTEPLEKRAEDTAPVIDRNDDPVPSSGGDTD
jgi:hypothetical protein